MSSYEQLIQIVNMLLPAWVVGLGVALISHGLARWGWPRAVWRWGTVWLVHGVLGSVVLIGGLLFFGVDGKMATYAALTFTVATVQWGVSLGWRRTS
jgi:hypothetical protein